MLGCHTRNRIISAIVIVTTISCATPALWKKTDPDECVSVSAEDITEEELQEQGLAYFVSDDGMHYYVDKSFTTKFRDYALRVLGTPVTVALDAVLVVVVGIAFSHSPSVAPPTDKFREKIDEMPNDELLSYYRGLEDRLKDIDRNSPDQKMLPDPRFEIYQKAKWAREELKDRKIDVGTSEGSAP